MKYYCKKNVYGSEFIIIFEKGKWYNGCMDQGTYTLYSIEYSIGNHMDKFFFQSDRFHKCFNTIQEMREIEINKILDGIT